MYFDDVYVKILEEHFLYIIYNESVNMTKKQYQSKIWKNDWNKAVLASGIGIRAQFHIGKVVLFGLMYRCCAWRSLKIEFDCVKYKL